MSGPGKSWKEKIGRAARLIRSSLPRAPLEVQQAGQRVASTMDADEAPERDDMAQLLVWLLELHRQDHVEIERLKKAFEDKKRGKRRGRPLEVQAESQEEDERIRALRDILNVPRHNSSIGTDAQGRRVLVLPEDKG